MTNEGITRRDFVAFGAALAAGAGCSTETGDTNGGSDGDMTSELIDLDAIDAVAAMQRGDLTAEAYAGALLARCEAGAHLNAFISLDPDKVLAAARDADRARTAGGELPVLHGLPIPVKDSVNTADYPTTGGTPALRDFVPAADAELVSRLRAAGAIVQGKTNIHELSFGWTSNNQAFGAVRNPYDPSRIPGGSSGGTAAAIAARMAPLGIAEDTQGSIRVPAALCGIAGFRPTQDRYPNQGVVPITPLFDQVGPHARGVADLALFDEAITGTPRVSEALPLNGMRIGVPHYFYEMLDDEVARVASEGLEKLADAGAVLVEGDIPELDGLMSLTHGPIQLYHVRPMLARYLEEFGTGLSFDDVLTAASPDIQAVFGRYVTGQDAPTEADFAAARDVYLPALHKTLDNYFRTNGVAAMVFPATQVAAPPIGDDSQTLLNGETVSFEAVISRNISPGSTGGIPGLVLPAGLDRNGLPVALEFDGPRGSDRKLLAAGLGFEAALGRLPPPAI